MQSILKIPRWGAPVCLVILLLLPFPAGAGDLVPRLVRDVDQTTYAGSSSPRQLSGINRGFAFTAFDNRELWTYDDTEDAFSVALQRQEIRQLGGTVYAAREESGGWTVWWVLGWPYFQARAASRKPLADLGAAYQSEEGFGPLLVEAGRGKARGLWRVDLAKGETVEIARPLPLADGHLLRDLTLFGQQTFFIARDRNLGSALWVVDPAGARPVFAPAPGETPGETPMRLLGVLKGRMLLAVSGGEPELWLSDGTSRGTRPLAEIVRGPGAAAISDAVWDLFHNRAYLIADDGRHGRQLWVTDGTAAGTRRVTRFASRDPFAASPLTPTLLADRLVFFADDGVHGRELWWTDGTPAGTRLLADVCPGACGTTGELLTVIPASVPTDGPPHPDRLLFSVRTPGEGLEPWSTDGTPGGTFLVRDLCPGPCDSDPRDLALTYVSGFAVTFTATASEGRRALWLSDGTAEGTLRLTPPGVTATSGLRGDLFSASDADFGDEFWTSERTPETTRLWKDLGREQDSGSYPAPLGTAGGKLIFTAFTPAHGRRIWESDGTAAGTVRMPVPQPDPDASRSLIGTTAGDRTFFLGPARGAQDNALWGTDGTAQGVVRLTPPAVKLVTAPYAAGRRAVFFAGDAEHGTELWASDGTPESTHLVTDLVPGPAPVEVDRNAALTVLNSQLVFRRLDDGSHIWTTDGTSEGTRRLIDLYPFLAPFENVYTPLFTEIPGKLFFLGAASASDPRPEVWVSDWTPAGTHPLGFPDADQVVGGLFPVGSRLFITAFFTDKDGAEREGLWVTDGTPGGAVRLPGTVEDERANGIRPTVYGERLVFTDEAGHLRVTDGTPAGTFALHNPAGQEIFARGHAVSFRGKLVFAAAEYGDNGFGPCSVWDGSAPAAVPAAGVRCLGDFTPVGPLLYFTGYDPRHGAEPWVFEEHSPGPRS